MSSFLNVSVLVLATMVLVLAGMVGYIYWQQNKVMTAVSSLSSFVASQFVPVPLDVHDSETEEEDDRASVVEEKPVEEQAPAEMLQKRRESLPSTSPYSAANTCSQPCRLAQEP